MTNSTAKTFFHGKKNLVMARVGGSSLHPSWLSSKEERSYPGGAKPAEREIASYAVEVVRELGDWGFIEKAEVVDPTWIDVAYTWSWPASPWRDRCLKSLEEHDIVPIGRYGRWVFQGIADSIRDSFYVGASLRYPKFSAPMQPVV